MAQRILLLSLSRALNVRNFLLYEFFDQALDAFDEVHLLTDFSLQDSFRQQFQRERVVFHSLPLLSTSWQNVLRKRLLWIYTLGMMRRFYTLPYTSMFTKGKRFKWNNRPLWTKMVVYSLESLQHMTIFRFLMRSIRNWIMAPSEFRRFLKRIKPDLVMTTYVPHAGEMAEEYLIGSARQEGIPVVSHISGVDNLTLKAPFLAVPDYVLVWNQLMKEHAEDIYPSLRRQRVFIAPPPQFAIYGDPPKLLDRPSLYHALGFHASEAHLKLLTFVSNGGVNYIHPNDELDIFERLYERIQSSEYQKQVVFFVRLSATRNEDEWAKRLLRMPKARTRAVTMAHSNQRPPYPWQNEPMDAIFLQSLVRHSSVLVSACSTLTLDACLCDVPSVSVAFDGFSKAASLIESMRRKPIEDHFLPLTLMGATQFSLNEQDLFEQVTAALEHPQQGARAREKARAFYFSGLIGAPHEETVAILSRLAACHA